MTGRQSYYNPATVRAGPIASIPVPPMALESAGLDYECALVVIIGMKCSDVPES